MLSKAFVGLLVNLAAAQQFFDAYAQSQAPTATWSTILADLQLKHETDKLENESEESLIADCDPQLIKDFPARKIEGITEFLDLFKSQFTSQQDVQNYFDNPGAKTLFIQTYDSLEDAHVADDQVHFNCGLETLLGSVQLHEALLMEGGVNDLQVVKFDLNILREELYQQAQDPTSHTLASLQRLTGDLTMPNQIYYFKKGKSFLYKGTVLVTEGGFSSLMLFKDHVDRFGMYRLNSIEAIDDFFDFSKMPYHDYFPLGSDAGQAMLKEELYDQLPLKTRVLCPMPKQPEIEKANIVDQADQHNQGNYQSFQDFQNSEPPQPPQTLLNLSIPMLDSLHVEFALVEDYNLWRQAQKKYWNKPERPQGQQQQQQSPGGISAGGCFILGDDGEEGIVKIDPERAGFDLQQPENFAMAIISAYQEHGFVIPFGAGHTFQLAPLLAAGSVHNPTVLIPQTSRSKLSHHEHLPYGYEFTYLYVEQPEEMFKHLSIIFGTEFDPTQGYLINDQLRVWPLGQINDVAALEHSLGLTRRNLNYKPLTTDYSKANDLLRKQMKQQSINSRQNQQQQWNQGFPGEILPEVKSWDQCGLNFPRDEYLLLAYSSEAVPKAPTASLNQQSGLMPPMPQAQPQVSAFEATQAWTFPLMHTERIFTEYGIPITVCKLDVSTDEIPEGIVQQPMKSFLGNYDAQIPQLFYMSHDRQTVINVFSPMAPVLPPQNLQGLADFVLSVTQKMSVDDKQNVKDAIEEDYKRQHQEELQMMKQKWAHHGHPGDEF